MALKNKAVSDGHYTIELRRLEEEIPKLTGKKREKAIGTYRELLWVLKDEPIYLTRYE